MKNKRSERGRFKNVYLKNDGKVNIYDKIIDNKKHLFDSLDLVVNNSNYNPEYLRKIYVIEFYLILKNIEKRIKQKRNG